MHRGLLMSDAERDARHAALYKVVTTHTSHTWAALLAHMLLRQLGQQNMARQTPRIAKGRLARAYRDAKKRLFLLDYDVRPPSFSRVRQERLTRRAAQGTLAPIVRVPSAATPSADTLAALAALTADARNLVYIISGRDGAFLEAHLGHFERLGMSAEHGGFVREPGQRAWRNFTEALDMSWMEEVLEIFKYYTEVRRVCVGAGAVLMRRAQRTTGSHIEVKKSSITWHYRSADPEWGCVLRSGGIWMRVTADAPCDV